MYTQYKNSNIPLPAPFKHFKITPIYRNHKPAPIPLTCQIRHPKSPCFFTSTTHPQLDIDTSTYMPYNPPSASIPSSPPARAPLLPRTNTSPNASRPALRLRISDNPLIRSSSSGVGGVGVGGGSQSAHPAYRQHQLPYHTIPCATTASSANVAAAGRSHHSSTSTASIAMRQQFQAPPLPTSSAASTSHREQQQTQRPAPIQTQTPALQSLRSAHSSAWEGSEPPSAVEERMPGVGGQEARPSGGDVPLPTFLRLTSRETQAKFVDLEWQQRGRMNDGEWSRLQNADTAKRNRYANVDPYEKNRIPLKVPDGHSDYINASAIYLTGSQSGQVKNFIATQGPKVDSYSHIWRMILDETSNVAVIVMLTQTHEMGKEKCFQYFPADLAEPTMQVNESDEFGDGLTATLTLQSIHEDESTRSTVRELELKAADGRSKKVYHYLFAGWPDFAIPEGSDRQALVNLIRKSRTLASSSGSHATNTSSTTTATSASEMTLKNNNPRIVHCSAGVGRTGTFIALDWLLDELADGSLDNLVAADGDGDGDGEVDADADPVADVVDRLRQQRMMMVQGEQQFSFLYDVVRGAWIERWRARP